MKVFVNDQEITMMPGMKVRHALMSADLLKDVASGKRICDEYDNEIGLDGALGEGSRIYVK
jgi:hypothetical protein